MLAWCASQACVCYLIKAVGGLRGNQVSLSLIAFHACQAQNHLVWLPAIFTRPFHRRNEYFLVILQPCNQHSESRHEFFIAKASFVANVSVRVRQMLPYSRVCRPSLPAYIIQWLEQSLKQQSLTSHRNSCHNLSSVLPMSAPGFLKPKGTAHIAPVIRERQYPRSQYCVEFCWFNDEGRYCLALGLSSHFQRMC